ncbi:pseudouridylate synthase [Plasmodium gonderi]|uniref:Pseudouridylate synthase n=1 Tax=Plasmodium gonderi TaxID=77519 RepID=A0A1Y1JJE7_PLAGO|nr:pseudouridylate synthase [Plasmodium gonderi]GAW80204.1 pseudouridylate synthase [Plasmodium gonderi]
MFIYGLLTIAFLDIIKSFRIMKIVITNTSGLNVVDNKFEPKYFTKNKLRFVSPYVYTYKLYTKKRWIGKKISDILTSEFCAYDLNYFKESIKKGYIKVNHENVTCDYLLKSNDLIQHKLLLFEKTVISNKIIILYEDENFLCVYKSASIPTHPVGFYQYNSLLRTLQNYITSCSLKKEQSDMRQNLEMVTGEVGGEAGGEVTENVLDEDVIKISFNFKNNNFKNMERMENSPFPDGTSPGHGSKVYCEEMKEPKKYNMSSNIGKRENRGEEGEYTSEKDASLINYSRKRKQSQTYLDQQKCMNDSGKNYKKISTDLNCSYTGVGDVYLTTSNHINNEKNQKDERNQYISSSTGETENLSSTGFIISEEKKKNDEKLGSQTSTDDVGRRREECIKSRDKGRICKKVAQPANQPGNKVERDDSYIYTLHRLDKLTSGIVLFGKNKKFSTFFSQNISNNKMKKSYITRVEGDFRTLIKKLIDDKKKKILKDLDSKILNDIIEKYCYGNKEGAPLPFNDEEFFKNDIFLYENKYTREDIRNGESDMKTLARIVYEKKSYLKDAFDVEKFEMDDYMCENAKTQKKDFDTYHKYFLIDFGYMYCEDKKLLKYVFTKYTQKNHELMKQYSLKPSVTKFMFLSYNADLNESLVLCQPITGRTHQIRAHLKSLTFPISNDAQYNEEFEKEYMSKSEYLHFDETEEERSGEEDKKFSHYQGSAQMGTCKDSHKYEEFTAEKIAPEMENSESSCRKKLKKNPEKPEKYSYFPLIPFLNTSFHWLYDDNINLNSTNNETYLNNYFFKKISNITYHSSGIFLHSFRYTWENVFDIFTLLPKWCTLFYIPKSIIIFLLYGSLS